MAVAPPSASRMSSNLFAHSRPLRTLAAVVFWPAIALWTWKLLEPRPVPESLMGELQSLSDWVPFLLAKSLHVLGNAFLAALIWLWVPAGRWRIAAVGLLLLHGVGTEIGQTFVPNRTGTVRDVLIDWIGVTAGILTARWATRGRSLPLE